MHKLYKGQVELPNSDSTEIFKEIDAIAAVAEENNDEDLLLETYLLRVNYYHYRSFYLQFPHELTTQKLVELGEVARKKNKPWLEARVEGILAVHYANIKQYEKEFEHFHRMYEIIKDMLPGEFPEKQNNLYYFANSLYFFRDYKNAIIYLKEGLEDTAHTPWNRYTTHSYNLLGLCYRKLNMLDSSSYYFRLILEDARRNGNEAWVGITSGNLGENYFLQKEYEKAKPLLQNDADIAINISNDPGLASNALMILGKISMEEKDVKNAEEHLGLARRYVYQSGQYNRLRSLYPALSRLYLMKGNIAEATVFMDSAFIVRDSLDNEFNTLFMTRAKQKVELEQHRAALDDINSQKEIKTLQRNALVVIVVLIMIIALFIYDRQKRRYREKNLQLKRAREELEKAEKELNSFTKNISEKNKLIEDLQHQIGDADSEAIRQLQHSTILTDEQWTDFRDLFDKVHGGYLQRLKEKLPGLTPAETRFIALSKLNLSNKEMAAMLGIGADAIRQHRSRLRKKLNLAEENNLEELLQKI
jgi:tetratricopeptide (TPR) repeat protein